MKIRSFIAGAALAISGIYATAAQALPDYSGSNVDMGVVNSSQSGTISNASSDLFPVPPHWAAGGVVHGFLQHNDQLVLNYSITGLINGQLTGGIAYDYLEGGDHYQGNATSNSLAAPTAIGTVNGAASVPLVFSSANLTVNPAGTSTGKIVFTNISNALASFQANFFGILASQPHGVVTITYGVSHVPLPAALPLFGSLLAGMFGFSRLRNRKAVALAA